MLPLAANTVYTGYTVFLTVSVTVCRKNWKCAWQRDANTHPKLGNNHVSLTHIKKKGNIIFWPFICILERYEFRRNLRTVSAKLCNISCARKSAWSATRTLNAEERKYVSHHCELNRLNEICLKLYTRGKGLLILKNVHILQGSDYSRSHLWLNMLSSVSKIQKEETQDLENWMFLSSANLGCPETENTTGSTE